MRGSGNVSTNNGPYGSQRGPPPPDYYRQRQQQAYPLWDCPVGPTTAGASQKKIKKRIVDKIGKTLDKIASPLPTHQTVQQQAQLPAWAVPVLYGSPQPSSQLWESPGSSSTSSPGSRRQQLFRHRDYEMTYDLHAQAARAKSSSPSSTKCSCNQEYFGSVRGYPRKVFTNVSSSRCKACRAKSSSYSQLNSLSSASSPRKDVPPLGRLQSYRDPYEFMRQARIGTKGSPGRSTCSSTFNSADFNQDWQSYWPQVEGYLQASGRSNNSGSGSHLVTPKPPSLPPSSSYFDPKTQVSTLSSFGPGQGRGKSASIASAPPAAAAAASASRKTSFDPGRKQKSILDPGLNPYILNAAAESLEEEADKDSQVFDSSSSSESSEEEDSDIGDEQVRPAALNKDPDLALPSSSEDPSSVNENSSASDAHEKDIVSVVDLSNGTSGESGSLSADDDKSTEQDDEKECQLPGEEQPKLSTSERLHQQRGQRKLLHSHNHRYFRRRASIHIDEVIFEEDEEALEAEHNVVSEQPKIKSILKQRSADEANNELHASTSIPAELASIEEQSKECSSLSPTPKKEVKFLDDMGNVESTSQAVRPAPSKHQSRPLPSTPGASSSASSDDEWQGYDKVIVSHNLAEEILDEIYGKAEHETAKSSECSSHTYEEFVSLRDLQGEKKSMADEILDELYGEKQKKKTGPEEDQHGESEDDERASSTSSVAPQRGVKFNLASKDDSILPRSGNPILELSQRLSSGRPCSSKGLESVSSLFNDTTRLRLQKNSRPSLKTLFSHEAPALGEGKHTRFLNAIPSTVAAPPRPKEPPPPPPPVTEVLRPVVPPRKFCSPLTQAEVDKINNVINGSRSSCHEGDSDDTADCFSTDEFSEDEFDSLEDEEDMQPPSYAPPARPDELDQPDPEEGQQTEPGSDDKDNIYDVAEYIEENPVKEAAKDDDQSDSAVDTSNGNTDDSGEDADADSNCSHEECNDQVKAVRSRLENAPEKNIFYVRHAADPDSSSTSSKGDRCSLGGSSLSSVSGRLPAPSDPQTKDSKMSHQILISSSSWINVQVDPRSGVSAVLNVPFQQSSSVLEDESSKDESSQVPEPIKPPRLKKLARMQRQKEELLHKTHSAEDIKRVTESFDNLRASAQNSRSMYKLRPEISAPVLLATTLNPNDAEAHKSLTSLLPLSSSQLHAQQATSSARSSSSSRRALQPSASTSNVYAAQHSKNSSAGQDKLSFKELKRLSSSLFPSLSNLGVKDSKSVTPLSNPLNRSSFYVADAVYEEATGNSRQPSPLVEHIYEEIPEKRDPQRPLPPIPEQQLKGKIQFKRRAGSSMFEGASKYEILHYLRDAKDRIGHADFEIDLDPERDEGYNGGLGKRNASHRVSALSHASDSSSCSDMSSGDGSVLLLRGPSERLFGTAVDIERTDSGVGSDTASSKGSFKSKRAFVLANYNRRGSRSLPEEEDLERSEVEHGLRCFDCDQKMEPEAERVERISGIVCLRCTKRRCERKEIIAEIFETEVKYGRDLRIIVEEFYRPMLVAGLLTSDQLAGIFLNAEELIQVNSVFTGMLKEAIDTAYEQGDEDLCTVNASASMLLTTLEKEKELLKIFLKVSQMENSTLRRMNLSSFLMVPVQRVTKYPLLLSRLQKVTPSHHKDRATLRNAKEKIEAALEQMNKDAKDVTTSKLWRRLPIVMTSSPSKNKAASGVAAAAEGAEEVHLKKVTVETLGWDLEETCVPLDGRLHFAHSTDTTAKRPISGKLSVVSAVLAVQSTEALPYIGTTDGDGCAKELIFPPDTSCIKDSFLILLKEGKNAKPTGTLSRDPLPLERCIVCCEPDWEDFFEIQDFVNKDSFVFRADDPEVTKLWFQTLQFYTQCLGNWRKRRKGLGHIEVDPEKIASPTVPEAEGAHED